MPKKEYPPIDYVSQCFRVEDGKIFWKDRPRSHFGNDLAFDRFNVLYKGNEAGWINSFSRVQVDVTYNGKPYTLYRHVIIWSIINGSWPEGDLDVDHKDGDTLDDRIEGLRLANGSQSCQNRKIFKTNTSGCTGVWFHKRVKKWYAQIRQNKKTIYGKYFNTFEEAREARTAKAKELFGEFYRETNEVKE